MLSFATTPKLPPSLPTLTRALALARQQHVLPTSTDPPITDVQIGVDVAELQGQTGCGDIGGNSANISSEVPCTFGDRSAHRTLVVVGDSMAGAWVPTLDLWGRASGWKVVRLVKDGCPPWVTAIRYNPEACVAFNAFEVRTINALKPQAVFAVGLRYRGQTTMSNDATGVAESILAFADELRPSGAKIFIPQNTPWFFALGSPLQCLAAYPQSIDQCNEDARGSVVELAMREGISAAARTRRITEVPVDRLFCSSWSCPVLVGNYIVYADNHHFSRVWALHIWRAFTQIFNPMVRGIAQPR